MRHLAVLFVLLAAPVARADDCPCDVTPAACDAACSCDSECDVDWTLDECAAPDAGCQPAVDLDEPALEGAEVASPEQLDPVAWPSAAAVVACPDGASNQAGACVPDPATASTVTGGCAAGAPGVLVAIAVMLFVLRRRRAVLALTIAACMVGDATWDDAVDAGPTGDTSHLDVFVAGTQYLLENQALAADSQPVAQFALARATGGVAISRVAGSCGDRLVAGPGAELLGWARTDAGDGTAPLVELAAPDGCTFVYETDPDAVASLVGKGYTIAGTLGHVWPPGLGEVPAVDAPDDVTALATPAPCKIDGRSAVQLLYASTGLDDRFLIGCPGEVIIGEKSETGPTGVMTTAAAHAAGGRTGFILDRNGDKLRALLARPNGVERTAAYLRHKLAIGYDYIVIDEVTGAADYADGQWLNRRLRQLMLRVPPRKVIPYISIDLTQELDPIYMNDRAQLLRSFKLRSRVLALEVYLHTGQVMAGEAPSVFRRAVDRVAASVHGLAGANGISAREIITIGLSHHTRFAQYNYLDQPSQDLAAISREANAIRHGSSRLRAEHGIGWYFVGESDLTPSQGYSYGALIQRMRTQGLRFR